MKSRRTIYPKLRGGWRPKSTHRVAMAVFWRTFHDDGKISPGCLEWGVHAHPLPLYLPSRTVYAPPEREDSLSPIFFISTALCTLWWRLFESSLSASVVHSSKTSRVHKLERLLIVCGCSRHCVPVIHRDLAENL
jgi:hypothetical protein